MTQTTDEGRRFSQFNVSFACVKSQILKNMFLKRYINREVQVHVRGKLHV